MINNICIYGSKEELVKFNFSQANDDNIKELVGETWTTNCMGVDVYACCDEFLTQEEWEELSKKYRLVDTGSFYHNIKILFNDNLKEKVSPGIVSVNDLKKSHGENKKENLPLDRDSLLNRLGVHTSIKLNLKKTNNLFYRICQWYGAIKLIPFNYYRPEEYVYLLDASKYTLNDLPNINETSSILLRDLKSNKSSKSSNIVFSNEDGGIFVAQLGTLLSIIDPNTIFDSLLDQQYVNSKSNIKETNFLKLMTSFNNIRLESLEKLIENDYTIT